MQFGMVDRTGPGMRQVVGFGDRSREGVFLAYKFASVSHDQIV